MKLFKLSCLAVAVLTMTACSSEQTPSQLVETEGMWADMKVESDGDRSRIVVELNVSGPNGNNVVLGNQDKLFVSAEGQSKQLKKDTDFLDVDYQEYMDVTVDDAEFNIQLQRESKADANGTTVILPKNFEIQSPLSSDIYTLDDTVAVTWDGLGEAKQVTLDVGSVCKNTNGDDLTQHQAVITDDDGQYDIELKTQSMFSHTDVDLTKDCTLSVTIRRENTGQVDSTFLSSSKIIAAQYRKVKDIVIDN